MKKKKKLKRLHPFAYTKWWLATRWFWEDLSRTIYLISISRITNPFGLNECVVGSFAVIINFLGFFFFFFFFFLLHLRKLDGVDWVMLEPTALLDGSQLAKNENEKVDSLHVPAIKFEGYKQLVHLFAIILLKLGVGLSFFQLYF